MNPAVNVMIHKPVKLGIFGHAGWSQKLSTGTTNRLTILKHWSCFVLVVIKDMKSHCQICHTKTRSDFSRAAALTSPLLNVMNTFSRRDQAALAKSREMPRTRRKSTLRFPGSSAYAASMTYPEIPYERRPEIIQRLRKYDRQKPRHSRLLDLL